MKMTEKNRNRSEAAEKNRMDTACFWLSLAVTSGGVLFLPQMLLVEGRGLSFSNSFLSVLVFLLAFPAVRYSVKKAASGRRTAKEGRKREKRMRYAIVPALSLGFVLACALGSRLEAQGYVLLTDWRLCLSLPFLTLFFSALLERLYGFLEAKPAMPVSASGAEPAAPAPAVERGPASEGKSGLLSWWDRLTPGRRRRIVFLFFLLVWGIVLLAVWPGFFVYDAQEEFNQVAQRQFTTHHPLVHVLLLGGIICAGNKLFGSYNAGIACYMIFQMVILSGCFTWVMDLLRKKGAPRWLRAAGTLYFAFFPVIQMYVLCSAKDTLYSAAMLMSIALLCQAAKERETFFSEKKKLLALGGSLCLMALMRHNGLYILLLMIPALAAFSGKGRRLRAAFVGLAALLLACGINTGLKAVFFAQDTENQEMLTVPIQQLARTWTLSPESFTEKEAETLLSFLPEDALARYTPKLSDPVKISFQNETYAEDPSAFWKLWLSIGRKAPASYLNAWLLTCYGFWYPDAVIDGYRGNTVFTFTYGESSYFGYETELPGERRSFFPWLDRLFEKMSLELFQQRLPAVSMLFSPGFLFWMYAAGIGFLFRKKRFLQSAAFLPAGLNWLTVLLGPACLVRYVLVFWFALPVLALVVSEGKLCYTNTTRDTGMEKR